MVVHPRDQPDQQRMEHRVPVVELAALGLLPLIGRVVADPAGIAAEKGEPQHEKSKSGAAKEHRQVKGVLLLNRRGPQPGTGPQEQKKQPCAEKQEPENRRGGLYAPGQERALAEIKHIGPVKRQTHRAQEKPCAVCLALPMIVPET